MKPSLRHVMMLVLWSSVAAILLRAFVPYVRYEAHWIAWGAAFALGCAHGARVPDTTGGTASHGWIAGAAGGFLVYLALSDIGMRDVLSVIYMLVGGGLLGTLAAVVTRAIARPHRKASTPTT